jgi:hypothetical protein
MHVPLRRRQIFMSRQLLNRTSRCAAHREVRTERMSESMHAARREMRPSGRTSDVILHDLLCEP